MCVSVCVCVTVSVCLLLTDTIEAHVTVAHDRVDEGREQLMKAAAYQASNVTESMNVSLTTNTRSRHLVANFQESLAEPVPECRTVLDFVAARDDDGWRRCKPERKLVHRFRRFSQFVAGRMPFLSKH